MGQHRAEMAHEKEAMMARTSLTAWVLEMGIRVTFNADGTATTLRGFSPDFDPEGVTYVTDATVGHLAAKHGIRIMGDSVSVARLTAALGASDRKGKEKAYTLVEILAHPFLGKSAPSIETIVAAYATEEAVAA